MSLPATHVTIRVDPPNTIADCMANLDNYWPYFAPRNGWYILEQIRFAMSDESDVSEWIDVPRSMQ